MGGTLSCAAAIEEECGGRMSKARAMQSSHKSSKVKTRFAPWWGPSLLNRRSLAKSWNLTAPRAPATAGWRDVRPIESFTSPARILIVLSPRSRAGSMYVSRTNWRIRSASIILFPRSTICVESKCTRSYPSISLTASTSMSLLAARNSRKASNFQRAGSSGISCAVSAESPRSLIIEGK